MMSWEIIVVFVMYLIFLMGVGVYFYFKTSNLEDFLIGSRGLGAWVTALSAQASDMSGWMLLGLPGAAYLLGLGQIWLPIGLALGTWLNWKYTAPRIRVQSEELQTYTLPLFLERKLNDPTGMIKLVSAIVILFFFTIYTASGFVASGKLFQSAFGISYQTGLLIGVVTVVVYTFLGGYLATCWTDFFQGLLMFCAVVIVPIAALNVIGGMDALWAEMTARNISTNIFYEKGSVITIASMASSLAWGVGYFGQPHILSRFMSVKNIKELSKARSIAIIWVVISLTGSFFIGLTGIGIFQTVEAFGGDAERIFLAMIPVLFNPWIAGLMLSAILSAIMSTVDSQLLVCSTTLAEDFYRTMKKNPKEKELVWIGRIGVLGVALIAFVMALNPTLKVFSLVSYAWAGFGSIFGPVILVVLNKNIHYKSALAGMIVAFATLIIWRSLGLHLQIYELIPAFITNIIAMLVVQKFMIKQ
ncbi:MAG: sodium/proline symporter PutP [Brevinema sp.]